MTQPWGDQSTWLTWSELAKLPLDQMPAWPACQHMWRSAHTMAEHHYIVQVHNPGLCDPTTCHFCADDAAYDAFREAQCAASEAERLTHDEQLVLAL